VAGDLGRVFAAGERVNQMLIERLDPACWRAKPLGGVRTVAAIFAHMHNVRCKWVRLSAPGLGVPGLLNRAGCSMEEARVALAESGERCCAMLGGGTEVFHRDGWSARWPAGVEMLGYMVAHEAHHRGQVCMLAHQLGYPLGDAVTSGMWNWEKIWRDLGV
jgi:uncharacterized damage-inducible protein DinB